MRDASQASRSAYVKEIGKNLRDVPWAERQALLDDVSVHLGDAGLAPGDLDGWIERFGTPSEYARQLRGDLELKTDHMSLRRARSVRLRFLRLRSKVLLGATVAIVAAVIGGAVYVNVWFDRFQPFTFDNSVTAFGGRTTEVGNESEHSWVWKRGSQFAFGSWLHNNSDRSIRVTKIELKDPQFLVPWDNWRITLGRDTGDVQRPSERSVRPFTLKPGEEKLLWFRGDFVRCDKNYDSDPPGTGGAYVGTRVAAIVTFEVRGRTLTRRIGSRFTYRVALAADYYRACHPR